MIYFAYQSTDPDALRATDIGYAGEFEYIPFGGMLFGIVHSHNYRSRLHIDSVDPQLLSLPGATMGVLNAKHIAAIGRAFPLAKKGDAMSTVLSAIYLATGHEGFNPNNH